jgi:hypothetical protein
MRFLLGFLFGASYLGNRVFRVAFLLLILFMVFCLYQMSKPLSATTGRLLHLRLTAVDQVDFVSGGGGSVVPHCCYCESTPVPEWLGFEPTSCAVWSRILLREFADHPLIRWSAFVDALARLCAHLDRLAPDDAPTIAVISKSRTNRRRTPGTGASSLPGKRRLRRLVVWQFSGDDSHLDVRSRTESGRSVK